MSKRKKVIIRLIAVVIAVLMPIVTATATNESAESGTMNIKYVSPDINTLTGHGEEPEEISVSATAHYAEKEWYEYVTYSENAVASYRIDDYNRLLFYDPYTYTNAMVMDVQFDATTTEFDTMSSYCISHTTSKTLTASSSSTYTSSTATQSSGRDETGSEVTNSGDTVTAYNHTTTSSDDGGKSTTKNYGIVKTEDDSWTLTESLGTVFECTAGIIKDGFELIVGSTQNFGSVTTDASGSWTETTVDPSSTTTDYTGEDKVTYNTKSETKGWTELSDRITKTLGSSRSTSTSWSETESTTITKTYAATHFASDGVTPLPWAIVHYTVQMPMKCSLQYKYEGEWITIATTYCMLTTVKGTCRAWMENGQVYYEDWGSGEPVVATDFWSQFMTKDQLLNAYQNKLYPVGGVDLK